MLAWRQSFSSLARSIRPSNFESSTSTMSSTIFFGAAAAANDEELGTAGRVVIASNASTGVID